MACGLTYLSLNFSVSLKQRVTWLCSRVDDLEYGSLGCTPMESGGMVELALEMVGVLWVTGREVSTIQGHRKAQREWSS